MKHIRISRLCFMYQYTHRKNKEWLCYERVPHV
nr:MAG TPA: hypothetical protein [Caudoviricetes sp.]DAY74745.1 MAG TPA: hypothetical protein [Caudoviricetes sp.]